MADLYKHRDRDTEAGTVMVVTPFPPRNDDPPAIQFVLFEDANVLDVSLDRGQVIQLRARLGRWLNEETRRGTP